MQEYIDRLTQAGMRPDDATVLVMDFMRELDFDGLEEYVAEYEALTKIVAIYASNITDVSYVAAV